MLLKNMVFDERYPNMRVDPDWWEGKHPQEFLPKVNDPTALYRPAVEVIDGPTAPVLTGQQIAVSQVSITWTPAETDISEILSYTILRGVDGAAPTSFLVCAVRRDFLGGIISVANCTTVPSIPHNDSSDRGSIYDITTNRDAPVTYVDTTAVLGHTYCYAVYAIPMGNNQSVAQGPPSPNSNTVCVTPVIPQATPPFLVLTQASLHAILNWTASTIAFGTIVGYQIFRGIDGGALTLYTTTGNVLTYTDTDVGLQGHTVAYYVIGVPSGGTNSLPSNIASEIISNDPFWDNVVLMLHFDGTNGSTTAVDSSAYNHTMTMRGAAVLTTATKKFGASSMSQPSTNTGPHSSTVVQIVQGAELDILSGTADFTIDGWFYVPSGNANTTVLFEYGGPQAGDPTTNTGGISLIATPSIPQFIFSSTAGFFGRTSTPVIATDTWHHFALVRASHIGRIFLDGVLQNIPPVDDWTGYVFPSNHACVVQLGVNFGVAGQLAPSLLDEFRVTAGIARWTANFTPPTQPTVP